MYTTITVKQILDRKGYDIWSIDAGATILDALRKMADKNIGALLVFREEEFVGIFSERDYSRKASLTGRDDRETPVNDVMTKRVLAVKLDQKIDDCLALMTGKFVRHLPVLDDDRNIVGVISIGDVVKELIAEQEFVIDQLAIYIDGEKPHPPVLEKSNSEVP